MSLGHSSLAVIELGGFDSHRTVMAAEDNINIDRPTWAAGGLYFWFDSCHSRMVGR